MVCELYCYMKVFVDFTCFFEIANVKRFINGDLFSLNIQQSSRKHFSTHLFFSYNTRRDRSRVGKL